MQHRLSAGVIVEHEGKLLLVNHVRADRYDFWVAPGGGVQGAEELAAAARREAKEETGIEVEPGAIAYIEELLQPELRHCKFWFVGRLLGGQLSAAAPQAKAEYIVRAAWVSRTELQGRVVFPPALATRYWQDRTLGFSAPVHLGPRRMEFW